MTLKFISGLLVVFWAFWITFGTLGNLADILLYIGYLQPDGPFMPGNTFGFLNSIRIFMPTYGTGVWVFLLTLVISGVSSLLFWTAIFSNSYKYFHRRAATAYGFLIILHLLFVVMGETILFNNWSNSYMVKLLFLVISLLTLYIPSRWRSNDFP
jgi:hypothetical protein